MSSYKIAAAMCLITLAVPPARAAVPDDAVEVAAWLDAYFAPYLHRQGDAASLGFVLVKDGRVLLQRGYGYSDDRTKKPVVPDETIFDAASVSKLITATAAMQLVAAGKLDLHRDVNSYLKTFQIRRAYDRPITLADLMTHTSGIDESFILGSVDRAADLRPLGEFFRRHPPRRVRRPGEAIVYSNWGMALVGHLVEVSSGMSFDDYVARNIFDRIGMTHATFRRPVPQRMRQSLATAGAGGQPIDKTAIQLFPSESLLCTVADMGRFIIAHLSADDRLLPAQWLAVMHAQHFTQHPHMPGIAYGFFEDYTNGHRALFHTGSGGHDSVLYLLPDDNVGFYLVYSGDLAKEDFQRAFMDRYYPAPPPAPVQRFETPARVEGLYRPGFIARGNIEKLVGLIADTYVRRSDSGTVTVSLPPLGKTRLQLTRTEQGLWRSGPYYVAFTRRAMFTSGGLKDATAYDRMHWIESGIVNLCLGIAGLLVFASFVVRIVMDVMRKRERRLLEHLATALSVAVLLAPVPVLVWIVVGDHSRPSQFKIAANVSSICLTLATVLAIPLLIATISQKRPLHMHSALVAVAGVVMIPYLWYWRLLAFWFA